MSSPITPAGDAAPRSATFDETTVLQGNRPGASERTDFEAVLARLEALTAGCVAPPPAPPAGAPAAAVATLDAAPVLAAPTRLQVPASAEGVQRWTFAFDDARHALTGVQFDAARGEPWQLTLQASAGDRALLLAHLDGLRARLMQRGAQIGALRCEADDREERR